TIAPCAEPNLAGGGSGDVLSGCLGTLMAQAAAHPSEGCESSSFLAACMGVHLHARAGRLLREAFPQRGNSATDIAEMLPRARIREAAGDGA
ncbi:NAD(P)H-hydrate dehydratase, partial [Bilophila wadsworthia]|uniref:NAD(P)H-hydrate dehydratase n=1 Tax=Bilophila wadsworthia TaxID=35833 RepID=UPI0039F59AF5